VVNLFEVYEVRPAQAKMLLWNAVIGRSSKIVVASMNPSKAPYLTMSFANYLDEMKGKFTPATESLQMKAEYQNRKQTKQEDIQNYINEKYELFKMAYPNTEDLSDFFIEVTKGIYNRSVRRRMYEFDGRDVAAYGTRAVFMVQVQRQQITNGDTDDTSMDGLVPVTKTGNTLGAPEAMEVDHLRREREDDEDSECECMAMHEQGFRGPCFYCQRKGHMVRNCPRKSAGLPKVKVSEMNMGARPKWKKGVTPKGQMGNRRDSKPSYKKVNHLEEGEDDDEVDEVDGDDVVDQGEQDGEVSFLGETL